MLPLDLTEYIDHERSRYHITYQKKLYWKADIKAMIQKLSAVHDQIQMQIPDAEAALEEFKRQRIALIDEINSVCFIRLLNSQCSFDIQKAATYERWEYFKESERWMASRLRSSEYALFYTIGALSV